MNKKHPNRKKDKFNPYTLSISDNEYFVSFTDGQGKKHKVKLNSDQYALFNRFELEDISQLNYISRYLEHSEMTEEMLNQRSKSMTEELEDQLFQKNMYEQIYIAVSKLPPIQRRRVMLYYFEGYTYEQIAKIEGCTKRAVKFSVDIAIKQLRKKIVCDYV